MQTPIGIPPNTPQRYKPGIVVLSPLFPSSRQPHAGLFIRERMFRVARHLPMVVIAPQPWFPFQSLIRRFKPDYRPEQPAFEVQDGIEVHFPRFLSVPGLFRWLDGLSMAWFVRPLMRRLAEQHRLGIIDAHFAYPAGDAATRLGRWFGVPVSITLRGTETGHLRNPRLRPLVVAAVENSTAVFSVSDSLRRQLVEAGARAEHIEVVGNGVDLEKFKPIARGSARAELGLPADARVLVAVGGLVERKGFHRVIEILPELLKQFPDLHYVVVGGASPEGDMGEALRGQARRLGLEARVRFTGPMAPERLCGPLSAADVFVLATRNEGWANVFLEAMACGLPVVTTDVGGNAEVVCSPELGTIVPFGEPARLQSAIADALVREWDRGAIMAYAAANTWDRRVQVLLSRFAAMRRTVAEPVT
jgi:teichuronic acid biosynthesis glycosyltransferase TuaC